MQKDKQNTELTILTYIEQNSDATQRDLSEHTGVSLGTMNLLLRTIVKKGLVKIVRLQPNSIKYFLTPAGIASKVERTYGYVVRTYQEVLRLRRRMITAVNDLASREGAEKVLFFGRDDELAGLIGELIDEGTFVVESCMTMGIEELVEALERTASVQQKAEVGAVDKDNIEDYDDATVIDNGEEQDRDIIEDENTCIGTDNSANDSSSRGRGQEEAIYISLEAMKKANKKVIIIVWEESSRELLEEYGIKSVNVMGSIEI